MSLSYNKNAIRQLLHQDAENQEPEDGKDYQPLVDRHYFYNSKWGERILKYMKEGDTLLDIGCGLGFLDIYVNHHLPNSKFVLLDKKDESSHSLKKLANGWHKSAETFKISADTHLVTKEFCELNGLTDEKTTYLDVSESDRIPDSSVDIICSRKSWGFHYPFDTHLSLVKRVLKPSGIVIIDVRRKGNQDLPEHQVIHQETKADVILITYDQLQTFFNQQ